MTRGQGDKGTRGQGSLRPVLGTVRTIVVVPGKGVGFQSEVFELANGVFAKYDDELAIW